MIRRPTKSWRLTFGGAMGLVIVTFILLAAIIGPAIVQNPLNQEVSQRLLPPGAHSETGFHLFGTDGLGRDQLARVVWGAQVSLMVGFGAVILGGTIGVILGMVAGYYGGWTDGLIMRAVDIFMALPFLILALALAVVLGAGTRNIIIALAALGWVPYARIVRAEVLSLREREFVAASRSLGASNVRIMFRHMLPNILPSLIVVSTLELGQMILSEASISYLGFGVQPPTIAWGGMTADGQTYIFNAWWVPIIPGLAVMLTVLGVNLVGDWLRDRSDPRLARVIQGKAAA